MDSVSSDEIVNILEELGQEAKDWMKREGIPEESQVFSYNIDMRYYRQGYEIPVEITPEQLAESGVNSLSEKFNDIHEQFYGFRMEDTPCEIVNLRAVGLGKVPKPHLPEKESDKSTDSSHAVIDEHEVYFEGNWIPTKIYEREKLQPGNQIKGPAIVTEFDSTTVILSGHQAEVDRYLNILINPVNH